MKQKLYRGQKLYKKVVIWDKKPEYGHIFGGLVIFCIGIIGFISLLIFLEDNYPHVLSVWSMFSILSCMISVIVGGVIMGDGMGEGKKEYYISVYKNDEV